MTPLTDTERAMVEANLGLAGWAVNRWARHLPRSHSSRYCQEAAYQDAVLGLCRAVQKYDPTTGFTFATYASSWLRAAIQRGEGDYEGINHRAATAGRQAPAPAPLSMDETLRSGAAACDHLTLADTLDDGHDHEADLIGWRRVHEIRALAPYICRDRIDQQILLGLTDLNGTRTPAQVMADVCTEAGFTKQAANQRLQRLRRTLTPLLADEAA
jgi:hypothetical protein